MRGKVLSVCQIPPSQAGHPEAVSHPLFCLFLVMRRSPSGSHASECAFRRTPLGVVLRHTKGVLSYYKTGLTGGEMEGISLASR